MIFWTLKKICVWTWTSPNTKFTWHSTCMCPKHPEVLFCEWKKKCVMWNLEKLQDKNLFFLQKHVAGRILFHHGTCQILFYWVHKNEMRKNLLVHVYRNKMYWNYFTRNKRGKTKKFITLTILLELEYFCLW